MLKIEKSGHKRTLAVPGKYFNIVTELEILLFQITNKTNLTLPYT